MSSYPVSFDVEPAPRFTRMQLFVRLAAVVVLGMLGVSVGTLFAALYLLLPIYAASRIASLGSAAEYSRQDGVRVMRVVHWFAAVSAWAGLAAEALPAHGPEETVRVTRSETPLRSSPVSAVLRILSGLLSGAVLWLLACVGVFLWLWAVVSILMREDVGPGVRAYLVGIQRWGVRLLAYQACLVEEYPPFSFADGGRPAPTDEQRVVAV